MPLIAAVARNCSASVNRCIIELAHTWSGLSIQTPPKSSPIICFVMSALAFPPIVPYNNILYWRVYTFINSSPELPVISLRESHIMNGGNIFYMFILFAMIIKYSDLRSYSDVTSALWRFGAALGARERLPPFKVCRRAEWPMASV